MLPLDALIVRHLLVNYRVDPALIEPHLPAPLRPQLIDGWAVTGFCLIALAQGRTETGGVIGVRTENAAHRIAVEWRDREGRHAGVYNARRDSDSVLHALTGGRVFPGVHHRAHFHVAEADGIMKVGFEAIDGTATASATVATDRPFRPSTLFPSLEDASWFFAQGAADYSVTRDPLRLDGVSTTTDEWALEPAELLDAHSTVIDSSGIFPTGAAHLDSAFLMRDMLVQWRARPSMRVAPRAFALASAG